MATLFELESCPIMGPTGYETSSGLLTMHYATLDIHSQDGSHQPNTILIDHGASGTLVYRKANTTNMSITSNPKSSSLLVLPLEIRLKIYLHLLCGTEAINNSMVPRMLSQVDIGFADVLPGAGLFLACKQLREESQTYLYRNTHFSARWAINSFSAIRRFRWGRCMSRIESLELHTWSIRHTCATNMSGQLHTIVSKMPALKYLRISTEFLGDKRDRYFLQDDEEQLDFCRETRVCFLRFGAFVTLRHPLLKLLVWGEPTRDSDYIDQQEGVVHYTFKIMADGRDFQSTDTVLHSTAIRQHTVSELLDMEAEDFKLSRRHLSSESPLTFRSSKNAIVLRRRAHAATSGVEHLAYLTADERERIGLCKPLNLDVLIMLGSKFAPYHDAVLASIPTSVPAAQQPKSRQSTVPTSASADHTPTGRSGRFKRGDLVNYMIGHTDYLTSMDDAFAAEGLPGYLKPLMPQKERVRKSAGKKRGKRHQV